MLGGLWLPWRDLPGLVGALLWLNRDVLGPLVAALILFAWAVLR